jgi:hypothetical protein
MVLEAFLLQLGAPSFQTKIIYNFIFRQESNI